MNNKNKFLKVAALLCIAVSVAFGQNGDNLTRKEFEFYNKWLLLGTSLDMIAKNYLQGGIYYEVYKDFSAINRIMDENTQLTQMENLRQRIENKCRNNNSPQCADVNQYFTAYRFFVANLETAWNEYKEQQRVQAEQQRKQAEAQRAYEKQQAKEAAEREAEWERERAEQERIAAIAAEQKRLQDSIAEEQRRLQVEQWRLQVEQQRIEIWKERIENADWENVKLKTSYGKLIKFEKGKAFPDISESYEIDGKKVIIEKGKNEFVCYINNKKVFTWEVNGKNIVKKGIPSNDLFVLGYGVFDADDGEIKSPLKRRIILWSIIGGIGFITLYILGIPFGL